MKKRFLCLFLAICLCLCMLLVACDDNNTGDDNNGGTVDPGAKQGQVHTTTDTSANVDPAIDRPSFGNDTLPQ